VQQDRHGAGAGERWTDDEDARGVVQGGSQRFEQRNLIRFRNYQKYGTEVTIVEEDTAPVSEEKPNQ